MQLLHFNVLSYSLLKGSLMKQFYLKTQGFGFSANKMSNFVETEMDSLLLSLIAQYQMLKKHIRM